MKLLVIVLLVSMNTLVLAADRPIPLTTNLGDLKKFRDPFKAPDIQVVEEDTVSDLEKYSTAEFRLIGIMSGPVRMRAIIAGPNGRTYTVAEKMRIGLREGTIKRITTKSIIVLEKIVNPLGETETVETELTFPQVRADSGGVR